MRPLSSLLALSTALGCVTIVSAKIPRVAHPKSKQAARMRHKRQLLRRDTSGTDFKGSGWQASAPAVSAPYQNIWDVLSNDEAADIIAFLHGRSELNLTAAANATA
jgi:primary-amine oxidase